MTPYTPKGIDLGFHPDMLAQLKSGVAEFYARHGITTELLTEPKGYRLAVYMNGVEIPSGLQGLADAIKE